MSIQMLTENNRIIIHVMGNFDARIAEDARQAFTQMLQDIACDVVIDLKEVDYIDSSGIGAIVFLYKRLRCAGFDLKLKNLNEQPMRLLSLLRIDKIINVDSL